MLSPSSQQSQYTVESLIHGNHSLENSTLRSPALLYGPPHHSPPISGYESLRESDFASEDPYLPTDVSPPMKGAATATAAHGTSGDYEGLEGIYKFLQVCEEAKR